MLMILVGLVHAVGFVWLFDCCVVYWLVVLLEAFDLCFIVPLLLLFSIVCCFVIFDLLVVLRVWFVFAWVCCFEFGVCSVIGCVVWTLLCIGVYLGVGVALIFAVGLVLFGVLNLVYF